MMTVDTLREQFAAFGRLMSAAGASSKPQDQLDRVVRLLEQFRDMGLDEFGSLLAASYEYRTTGEWPQTAAKSGGRRGKAAAVDVGEAVQRYVGELESLYGVVHEETTGQGAINDLLAEVEKLPVAAIRQVAAGFGLKLKANASKKVAVQEIRAKLEQRKASAERNTPIHAGSS